MQFGMGMGRWIMTCYEVSLMQLESNTLSRIENRVAVQASVSPIGCQAVLASESKAVDRINALKKEQLEKKRATAEAKKKVRAERERRLALLDTSKAEKIL